MMYENQPLSPVSFLERSARVFPDRIAVVDGETRFTYRQFSQRAAALASGLAHSGVAPGDRVAFLATNGEPLLTAHFGVAMAGAVLVAINTRLARDEVLVILRHSGAKVLVGNQPLLAALGAVKSECPELQYLIGIHATADDHRTDLSFEGLLDRGRNAVDLPTLSDENRLVSISYTSGTTGHPKGVMYTHRGAYLNALGNALEVGLTSDTRYLWTLPMFHCNGWCYPWSVTSVGGTQVCMPKVVPSEVFRLVADQAITHLCAAPTVLIDLAHFAQSAQIKLEAPLTIMTGGAPPAPQVIQNVEDIGARIIHLYGLTETYGPSTFCQWHSEWDHLSFQERAQIKARQGVADLMVEQRVIRSDMTDVAPNGDEVGEIVYRGNAVTKGYFNDPEATAAAFHGGWFHTGDLAVVHPDGYIEIKDRAKDLIISGGENISSLEVERVIYTHPAVLEVAVVASPHPRWGEVPTAYVVPRPGATLTSDALHTHCRKHLAGFKVPKRIEFVDALPKTSTGKILKHQLRQAEQLLNQERTVGQ